MSTNNVTAGVPYDRYSWTSGNMWEREASRLWDNVKIIIRGLQDAIITKAQNPPSDELIKAVGSRRETSSLVYQHNKLKEKADEHFLPPPDLDEMKRLCSQISAITPPLTVVQIEIDKLEVEIKTLEKIEKNAAQWMKNFDFSHAIKGFEAYFNKLRDIAKGALGPSEIPGIIKDWTKEFANMGPKDIHLPEGPFVKDHQQKINNMMDNFLRTYRPDKQKPWMDILGKLKSGAQVKDLERLEQSELETIVKKYHEFIRNIARKEIEEKRLEIEKKKKEKKILLIIEKNILDNLDKYKALCKEIESLTDWTQVTPTPRIRISKVSNPSAPKSGDTVTYTYTVTNIGNVPLKGVVVDDDKCSSKKLKFLRGDDDSNGILDKGETWVYECSMTLTQDTTNTGTAKATGLQGGEVTDSSTIKVAIQPPPVQMKTVPDVVGLEQTTAEYDIKKADLKVGNVKSKKDTQRAGVVISQDPIGGTKVPVGTKVNIAVSSETPATVRTLYVDPASKTIELTEKPKLRALLWFTDGREEDVTNKAIWSGADSTGVFTPTKPGKFQITASFSGFSASSTITVREPLPPQYSPPMSHADDRTPGKTEPSPDAYTWYVFCHPDKGEVVYGEHPQMQDKIMAGPFPGPRNAQFWIQQNCPRWRCTAEGGCAKEPAYVSGGQWAVVCDKKDLKVYSTKNPLLTQHWVMQQGFLGGPDADLWIQKNCPKRLCIDGGGCAKADAPRKGGKWAVVCDKNNGSVALTEYPNVVSQWIWGENFFGEVDARMWANQKCPTWRCDRDGKCLPGNRPLESATGRPLELPPDFSNIGSRFADREQRRGQEVGDRRSADASRGSGETKRLPVIPTPEDPQGPGGPQIQTPPGGTGTTTTTKTGETPPPKPPVKPEPPPTSTIKPSTVEFPDSSGRFKIRVHFSKGAGKNYINEKAGNDNVIVIMCPGYGKFVSNEPVELSVLGSGIGKWTVYANRNLSDPTTRRLLQTLTNMSSDAYYYVVIYDSNRYELSRTYFKVRATK